MPIKRLIVGELLCLSALASVASAADVAAVRVGAQGNQTRVALDLDEAVEHQVFTLSNPSRVVIDVKRGRLAGSALPLPGGAGVVSRVRGANRADGSARVVLDLVTPATPRSFVLPAEGRFGPRLVIDLEPLGAPEPVRRFETPTARGRELVIAIDPGHGGKDPGARGPSGAREKDVVLAISRDLAAAIDAEPGMRAFMTRGDDRFVPLRTRMERARAAQADLFLSIHADAFRDRRVRGTTVYVLSGQAASDEAARRLAERENAADLIGGVSLADKDDMLASVLLDLSQNAALSASIDVGEALLDELGRFARLRKRQVQQAPFLVLKSPDVPSLLIETAFISNPEDERNLVDERFQRRLATAMLDGIRSYFYANPPPGTEVALLASAGRSGGRQYVIRAGDTLSEIADRYQVSVGLIRSVNRLADDRIVVGQVLTIPGPQGI